MSRAVPSGTPPGGDGGSFGSGRIGWSPRSMDDRDLGRRAACRDAVNVPGVRPETVTVLFTDVAGSTAWRAAIGDGAADVRVTEWAGVSHDVTPAMTRAFAPSPRMRPE
jgi:hypothetical protein